MSNKKLSVKLNEVHKKTKVDNHISFAKLDYGVKVSVNNIILSNNKYLKDSFIKVMINGIEIEVL